MSGFESTIMPGSRMVRESRTSNFARPRTALSPNSVSQTQLKSIERKKSQVPYFPSLLPGDTFAGFRIERELGRGGMGAVFLAESRAHGTVALKISSLDMKSESFAHAITAGRAYKGLVEALESGTYQHENNETYNYLAIRYVPGPTLAKLLRHDVTLQRGVFNVLPPERSTKIARKIALAAGEMHRAGLVHADIKPANIILKSKEDIALFDYGMAKHWPVPESIDGEVRGTPSHMAPEQLLGESCGPAVDVFAMGVTLWEMLTGNPAREHRKLQIGNFREGYEPLPPLPAHLPPRYQEIVNKATALYPQDRYPDGHALARALAEI